MERRLYLGVGSVLPFFLHSPDSFTERKTKVTDLLSLRLARTDLHFLVSLRRIDILVDTCAICKNQIMDLCKSLLLKPLETCEGSKTSDRKKEKC